MRRWQLRWIVLVAILAGCDSDTSCPSFPSRAQTQPARVEAATTQLSERGNVEVLLVDAGDLYWYDELGAILKLPRGESRPVELRPAPGGFVGDAGRPSLEIGLAIDGFTSDAERLYWGEANRYTGFDSGFILGFDPPARLLSIAKSGGAEQLLLTSTERTLRPVAVDTARVIVRSNDGFHQLLEGASQLEPLPAKPLFETSRVIGNQIYWTEPAREDPLLFRSRFDQAEPETVARIAGSDFEVGPGYVLWRQERLHTEPELVLEQNFVLLDEARGCTRLLPGLGESISFTTARDDEHVYWYSFNALGSVTDSSPGTSAAPPTPEMPLVRVALSNGVLERLETPGFRLPLGAQIVGQDEAQVYVSTSEGLTAVRKP